MSKTAFRGVISSTRLLLALCPTGLSILFSLPCQTSDSGHSNRFLRKSLTSSQHLENMALLGTGETAGHQ